MTEDKRSIIQMVAGLIEQGKKNQDKIAYSKILDTFSGAEISSEQFDNILKASSRMRKSAAHAERPSRCASASLQIYGQTRQK